MTNSALVKAPFDSEADRARPKAARPRRLV